MLEGLKRHLWGFKDICFQVVGITGLFITGTKYDICNKVIPNFLYFICNLTGNNTLFDKKIISNDTLLEEYYSELTKKKQIKRENVNTFSTFLKHIEDNKIVYSVDGYDILSHSHGQLSVDEIYRVKYGDYRKINTVDIVIYPEKRGDCELIYTIAKEYSYRIIPYGGGTNVTGCLLIPEADTIGISIVISLDMRHYNKILQVDKVNNYAIIQSGACGKEIEDELNRIGYTMGHEPDSYEFSTLGGWISTYASGMRRNKYGNIEDIVIDFGYVNDHSKSIYEKNITDEDELRIVSPLVRCSHGLKTVHLLFGHEGNFGIITDVIVNIKKLPEAKTFESILFYNMKDGVDFLKEVYEADLRPSSIRLVDNEQFKFSQALKPEKSGWMEKIIDKIKKFYLFSILKFNLDEMVACTLMIEGTSSFCKYTLLEIQKIAKKYNAVFGGSDNGLAGYNLTHAIAYIRDFMHEYNVIGETFETSIEWDKALIMAESVKNVLMSEYGKYMRSKPFLSYRVSQTYSTGVCIYFTFGFNKNEETTAEESIEIYHILEKQMRKKMRDMGGSISHHHGIGQVKSYELDKNDKTTDVYFQIKKTFDSNNTFCENNYLHLR